MNLKNHRPVFVPQPYCAEIEKLSKAALMDMVWDYARQVAQQADDQSPESYRATMQEFRERREIILTYRSAMQ